MMAAIGQNMYFSIANKHYHFSHIFIVVFLTEFTSPYSLNTQWGWHTSKWTAFLKSSLCHNFASHECMGDMDNNTSHTDRTEECTSLMIEVLTVVLIRICAFYEVTPCQLIISYQCLREV